MQKVLRKLDVEVPVDTVKGRSTRKNRTEDETNLEREREHMKMMEHYRRILHGKTLAGREEIVSLFDNVQLCLGRWDAGRTGSAAKGKGLIARSMLMKVLM